MGTNELKLGTLLNSENIAASLFGKTRRAVLTLLYSHVDERFHFRHIARIIGLGVGALQRELKNLSDVGIISKSVQGNQVYYQANPNCPIYIDLKNLVMKTTGVSDVLKNALMPLAERIIIAFVFGSIAKGNENLTSDIDIVVIGNVTFAEVVSRLSQVQEIIRREINPIVYPPAEYRSKFAEKNHFIRTVLNNPKFFIIGDENELKILAE